MNDNHPAGFMKTLRVPFHMSGTPLMFPPNRPLKDSSVAAEPNRGSFKIDDGDVIGRFCLNIVFGIMLVTWFSKGVHHYNTQRKPNFLKRRNFSVWILVTSTLTISSTLDWETCDKTCTHLCERKPPSYLLRRWRHLRNKRRWSWCWHEPKDRQEAAQTIRGNARRRCDTSVTSSHLQTTVSSSRIMSRAVSRRCETRTGSYPETHQLCSKDTGQTSPRHKTRSYIKFPGGSPNSRGSS